MIVSEYKTYFNSAYKGADDFDKKILTPILGKIFPAGSSTNYALEPDYIDAAKKANIKVITDVGEYSLRGDPIRFFDVTLKDNSNLSVARVNIRKVVTKLWKENFSGAIIIFHYDDTSAKETWRFSWVERRTSERNSTPGKRYTYLCGPSYSCRTIAQRFDELQKNSNKTLDSITMAFDVEALSKDFFYEYKVFYDDIIQWITGSRYVGEKKTERKAGLFKSDVDLYKLFADKCKDINKKEWAAWSSKQQTDAVEKFVRDWVKKLMGRMVFLQFIQKKGWLGISDKVSDWKGGSQNFLLERFYKCSASNKNFLKDELYAILFDSLNKSTSKDSGGVEITKRDGLKYPFLNGGLFEEEPADTLHIELPNDFFHNEANKDNAHVIGRKGYRENNDDFFSTCGLLDFFSHYNFTIDENASEDDESEVGIDPEMLSKVFENLLEDNKEKGAFYTPKEVVQYMCKESLIAYLCDKVKGMDESIRCFVETQKTDTNLLEKGKELIKALHNVKICDPAVGSGAFPMGLLNLMLKLRLVLNDTAGYNEQYDYAKLIAAIRQASANDNDLDKIKEYTLLSRIKCAIKKSIIQNNIYGVDIEKGAVDLARLRFWLNIVVDEDKPTPLPNLDFKIMQGNSLLESYEGIDLSKLAAMKTRRNCEVQCDLFGNIEGVDKEALYVGEKFAHFDLQKEMDGFIDISYPAKKKEIRQRIEEYIHCALCNTLAVRKWEIQASIDNLKCLPQLNNRQQKELNKKESEEGALDAAIENLQSVVNDKFFLWHTWFADVFAKNGFDIVIGNPPYFNIETLGAKSPYANAVKETYSNIWQDKSDILFYFFELAMNLSRNIVCFITSNAYLFSDKARKLRNSMIQDGRLKKITNFEEFMIFNNADITTCISMFNLNNEEFKGVNVKGKDFSLQEVMEYIQDRQNEFLVRLKEDCVFALVDNKIDALNLKIDGEHELLENLFEIGEGMQTGVNPVFCFSEYPAQFPTRFIKRRMGGINRYYLSGEEEYLLYIEDVEKFEDLPQNIQEYLNNHKNELFNRAQIKRSRTSLWWKFTFAMHKELYPLHKIWCSYRSKTNEFVLDESQDYIGLTNTTVVFDTNQELSIKYLLALLNSKLLTFRYKSIGKQTGSGVYEYYKNGVGKLPIPKVILEQKQIIFFVDQILTAKKAAPQADTTALEHKIDILVYLLYGLTWDEVQIVENSL